MKRYNRGDLTRRMGSIAPDRDPTAVRRCVIKRLFAQINLSPSSRSDGHDIFETVHDGPFHRNRRSFRSDGYAQIPYKQGVLPICKYSSLKSSKLICLDTSLLESLDSILFYSHFCIHEGLEIEIWLKDRRNQSLNSTIEFFTFFTIKRFNHVNLIAILD